MMPHWCGMARRVNCAPTEGGAAGLGDTISHRDVGNALCCEVGVAIAMVGGAGPVVDDEQPGLFGRYGQFQDELAEVDRADRLADLLVAAFGAVGVAARRAPAIGGPWLSVGVVLDGASYLISVARSSSPAGTR